MHYPEFIQTINTNELMVDMGTYRLVSAPINYGDIKFIDTDGLIELCEITAKKKVSNFVNDDFVKALQVMLDRDSVHVIRLIIELDNPNPRKPKVSPCLVMAKVNGLSEPLMYRLDVDTKAFRKLITASEVLDSLRSR